MGSHTRWLLHLTIISALLFLIPAAKDNIAPGELVRGGDYLISADGRFRLGFFTPASNSKSQYLGIWYTVSVPTIIWVANRDRPISGSVGGVLSISGNGTLVLADAKGTVYWSTGAAAGVANPVARLLNTSNFVVTGASGDGYAWQSFDHPTDSMVPGLKLGWSRSTGRNRSVTVTSWKSSDPAPGEYAVAVDVRGDPQLFLMRGTTRIWRTGPWMGQRFTGVPEMTTYESLFRFAFSNDADDRGAFWYDTVNRSVLSRLVVHPAGGVEGVVWNENTQTWNRYWFAPKDLCDGWGTCGPFGVCDTSYSPVCRCVQGFVPRSPKNWSMWESTEGCVRRTSLDCRNRTDGFVKVAQVKLPDTSAAVVNYTMGLVECEEACLRNCACAAYANAEVVAGVGKGCILWGGNVTDIRVNPQGGEDLFVRLAAADLGSSSTQAAKRRVAGITVAAVVLGLLLLGWTGWCLWKRRRKTTTVLALGTTSGMNNHWNEERNRGNHEDLELPLFDFNTIATATDDFSAENKLGEGGFGPVFKGRLKDRQEVVVKRLARTST